MTMAAKVERRVGNERRVVEPRRVLARRRVDRLPVTPAYRRVLVCEGVCNPQIDAWDVAARFQSSPRDAGLRVEHTPHAFVGIRLARLGQTERVQFELYACTVCGHERRLGWSVVTIGDAPEVTLVRAQVRRVS